jgi:prepilin-type N-terminal cleavage/methylation domain-containing protein
MRRGYTLLELLTSISVLAVILGVMLPLIFMGDRALTRSDAAVDRDATAVHLLGDISRDLRGASAVSIGSDALRLDGVTYRYLAAEDRTLRQDALSYTAYPGARFAVAGGRLMTITIHGRTGALSARLLRRNR